MCKLDFKTENLRPKIPEFTVKSYIELVDDEHRKLVKPQHLELAEYYFDHYQYIQSLSLKD